MLSGTQHEAPPPSNADPQKTAALLLKIWSIRARGFEHFSDDFGEVPWNILLDLTCSAHQGRAVVASDLAIAYNIPKTTMNRYVDYLHNIGLVEKKRDRDNRVRVLLSLTEDAKTLMAETLSKIGTQIESREA